MDTTDPDDAHVLAPLRDAEPVAPSTVDVARAVRVGTRRRRTRQALSAVAVAAVVALVLAVVPVLVGGRHDSAPPAQQQVVEFDVLRQHLTVGSAGGYTPVSLTTGRHAQRVELRVAADPTAPPSAEVVMYVADRADVRLGDAAPDVHGHRAYWLADRAEPTLAWEWAPAAWVLVTASAGNARAVLPRVALSVRTDGNTPVRVPFTIGPLSGPRLAGVVVPYGATGPDAGALVVLEADEDIEAGGRIHVGVSDDADVLIGAQHSPGPPNTQLGGRQATVNARSVRIYDVGLGWDVVAEASTGAPDLAALAQAVTLVADAADPRSWTTDPVR